MTAPEGWSYRMRRARVHFLRAGATIDTEVVQTRYELAHGLRGRTTASPMLFLFPYAGEWMMTMSGMLTSLDILFLDDAGTLVDVKARQPQGKLHIKPSTPCKYVLELPSGWTEAMGLRVGDRAMILPLVG